MIYQQKKKKNNIYYFSFDETEVLIKKLKSNYDNIKSKTSDIKELSKIENINNLDDIMGNISTQIEELTKTSFKIFDSYKKFFDKHNHITDNNLNNLILNPHKNDIENNNVSNSGNNKIIYYKMKTNKNLKNKIINLGFIKNNINITIKDTTTKPIINWANNKLVLCFLSFC